MSEQNRAEETREQRIARGLAMVTKVYPGEFSLPEPHPEHIDQMLVHLFADVWDRQTLSMRDRRLVVIGVLSALGEAQLVARQARASMANGELSADEVRELLMFLPAYVGYPRAGNIFPAVEQVLREAEGK